MTKSSTFIFVGLCHNKVELCSVYKILERSCSSLQKYGQKHKYIEYMLKENIFIFPHTKAVEHMGTRYSCVNKKIGSLSTIVSRKLHFLVKNK